jgi:hypothetical protein
MGLGVVALYLLLAVWISSRLRAKIGHRAWRSIHALTYAVYGAATIHGLGTGSDTRTAWALILYASSVCLVGALAARRLLVPVARGQRRRPVLAAAGALAVVAGVAWAAIGPLASHWGARAGGTSGNRVAASASRKTKAAPAPKLLSGVVASPFEAAFNGRLTVGPIDGTGRVTIRIDGALQGSTRDHLEILLRGTPLADGGVSMEQSRVRMGAETPLYEGEIVALRGSQLVADVHSVRQALRLGITLHLGSDGQVSGSVRGTRTA